MMVIDSPILPEAETIFSEQDIKIMKKKTAQQKEEHDAVVEKRNNLLLYKERDKQKCLFY